MGYWAGSSSTGPPGLSVVSPRFASVLGRISASPSGEYDCGPIEAADEGAYEEEGDMYFDASGVLFEKGLYLGVVGSIFILPGLDFE